MKGNFKLGLGILAVVVVLIALIQASQKQPINWQRTYNPEDKIPFGTYVIRHELKNIFPEKKSLKPINQSLYQYFEEHADSAQKQEELIFIGNYFNPGKAALGSLLHFVSQGNTLFVAAEAMPDKLADTLGLQTTAFNIYQAGIGYKNDTVYYTLAANQLSAQYTKSKYQNFFSQMKDSATTILGYLKRGRVKVPNFIKVKFGKGLIYCQLTPEVYSNYAMLNQSTYLIAYQSIRHLQGKNLLWFDGQYDVKAARTPLRFILSRPALRAGWYLLLVTLLLYLIFKGKREQKAIPIVKPEENLSVAFAETIGALYYENGHPGSMTTKKINYFLYDLKKKYRLDEGSPDNPNFRKQAANRLHLSPEEINDFFDQLVYYQKHTHPDLNDLKTVQNIIEDFKQKIQWK